MLSVVAVISVCVALSVSFLFIGSLLSVWILRLRDRRKTRLSGSLGRGLSTYHRAHLSIDGANYSHVQQPRAALRRSGHLPSGVITDGWREVPSQECIRSQQMTPIQEQPEIDELAPAPDRRKSLRETLHGHPLNVSKIRRQKKGQKTIAQDLTPVSPLPAITEFPDVSEATALDVAKLPTCISHPQTPEKAGTRGSWGRPVSIQWPLPLALRRSKDTPITLVTSVPARESILMRKASVDITVPASRPSIGRSLSMGSAPSGAPEGPLPPLPLHNVQRYSQHGKGVARRSDISLDTSGSSVLGSVDNSTSRYVSYNPATLTINLSSPGPYKFSPASIRGSPPAITVGMPAGKRAQQGNASCAGTQSFKASIGEHAAWRNVSNSRTTDHSDQRFKNSHIFEDPLKTIDARYWKHDLPLRMISHRSSWSPSLTAPVACRPHGTSARHSIFDSQLSLSRPVSNPVKYASAAETLTGSPGQLAPPRPASVASGNPYQWDLRPPSFAVSPLPLKKGHKRQNCVRISNLPAINPERNSKLPEMTEEEEEEGEEEEKEEEVEEESQPKIPGLTLLEVDISTPALRARASLVDVKASPSPFHNRQILAPRSRKQPSLRRQNSAETQKLQRPDSDIFTNSLSDPSTVTMFNGRTSGSRSMGPLSPTPQNNVKLNSTSPTLAAIKEPSEHDSPMLPSPALASATLFPRISRGPQGPREAPVSARGSRNVPVSPLNGRTAQKPRYDELRRSVMILRRDTSDGMLPDQTSRLYRNMGQQSIGNFSLPSNSHSNLGLVNKSTNNTFGNLHLSDKRGGLSMALSSAIGTSRSKLSMSVSPSILSIWDDASVCEDVEFDTRTSIMSVPERMTLGCNDPEAYENFVMQEERYVRRTSSDRKDRERKSTLISPQGKGLGIRTWGTPGSLYDRDGFLKEA